MRGHDVSFECDLGANANLEVFYECIRAESVNQARQGTWTEAFSLGFYFTAAFSAEIYYEDGRFAPLAKGACKQYMSEIKKGEKALKMKDEQLINLFHMTDKARQTLNKARLICI